MTVLDDLYDTCPLLQPAYISEILKLDGETADKVGRITGGIHRDEAELVMRVTTETKPLISLEIGLGYGFSALAICLASQGPGRRHIVIDPHQTTYWKSQGLKHLAEAGFGAMVDLREDYSYRVLPELERDGLQIDLAFIDGWHTFDFVMVDFFFVDKLLRPGSVVMFDDADWPSIRPILRYAVTNLGYEVAGTLHERKPREAFDVELGLDGSCIALRKPVNPPKREIFFHKPFGV